METLQRAMGIWDSLLQIFLNAMLVGQPNCGIEMNNQSYKNKTSPVTTVQDQL